MKNMDEAAKKLYKITGENIKRIRQSKGMSLEEVSQKTGMNTQYLNKIEEGIAFRFNILQLKEIADLLNVYLEDLLKGD